MLATYLLPLALYLLSTVACLAFAALTMLVVKGLTVFVISIGSCLTVSACYCLPLKS